MFFQRKAIGKLIRQARRDTAPLALAVRLGHNAVIFIGKRPFNRTNEKRDEKGNDNEEYTQTNKRCKPTHQRREYSNCRMVLCEIASSNPGGSKSYHYDDESFGVLSRPWRDAGRSCPHTYHSGSIGEKLFHRYLFPSEKQWGNKTQKPPSSVVEYSDARGL
jgi:hypothetical protein